MRRALRMGLIVLAVPLVLVALLCGALLTLGNTVWGRQHVESVVGGLTHHHVQLIGLEGDLLNRPTLRELQLADAHGIWLTAYNIEATWRPWALLERRVAIGTGHIERIDWVRLPVSQSHRHAHARIPDIDAQDLSADTVNLGPALAGIAATLNLHASAHLRTLEDMQMAFAATRLDGPGTYAFQLAFDRNRMDAALNVREPAHGPLAGLFGVNAGAVQVAVDLSGPRQSERINLHADVGDLHASATGAVDLVHHAADLQYAADASAMTPRADLSWQRLHVQGSWHGTLATATADANVQLLALVLPAGIRIGALNGTLQSRAGELSAQARVENAAAPGVPPGLLSNGVLVADGSIRLEEPTRPFQLHVSYPTFELRATGQAAGTRALDGDLNIGDVARVLPSIPEGLSGPLRLHVTAQQAQSGLQLRLTGSGMLASTVAGVQPWLRGRETADLRASYDAGKVTLDSATVANKALNAVLSGRLNAPKRPGDPWTVSGKSHLTLADLSLVLPALSGQANIAADLSGSTTALRVAGDLQAAVGIRNGAPSTLRASFDVRDLPHAPQAQLKVRGQLGGAPLDLQADVEVTPGQNVHIRLPQAAWQSLHAQGDLTLAQDLDRSTGQLKWSVANLADVNQVLGLHLAGSLNGALNLVPAGQGTVASTGAQTSLRITTAGLQIGALKVEASLTGTGPLDALNLSLAAKAPLLGAPAELAVQALLDAAKSNVTLTALTGVVRGVPIKLQQPAQVDFAHGLSITGLRATLADAVLTASGEITPQLQLKADLTDATAGLIDAVLPGYLDSGKLHGTVQVQGTLARPVGEVKLIGTDLRAAGDGASLPPVQLTTTVDLTTEGAKIALRTTAGDSTHMTVEGTVPWNAPLAVTASGNIDLTRFNPLLESVGRRITGTLDVNAQMAGTVDAPTVKGTLQLHSGAIHDYRHGIDLTDIEGTLEGTQNELRITQLTAHATSGTVGVTGTLGVLQGGWPVDLKFTARNAQPLASSIVSGNVNADLTLTGTALHELTLAGSIQVNRATVQIPNSFPPNVVVLDVRRPGDKPVVSSGAGGPVINLKVSVNAPRQILVRGRGLDAELGGRVQIGGTARAPTVDGGFDLQRGLFTLAGSRLNFSSGRVSFAGSDVTGTIDPALDFTAQTTTLDTTVTLRITGVADAPQFDLTSVPQLPQDEILARLLFGVSAGQLTAIQAAQLGAALVTLTGVGTGLNPLAEVQKHLGLDRLNVASNDTNTPGSTQNSGATIEAGRYVTNRIFVNLKQNTTGATQLQVDVDLTQKLKLQTQVGTGTATVQGTTPDNDPGSSVGLSYRFEY